MGHSNFVLVNRWQSNLKGMARAALNFDTNIKYIGNLQTAMASALYIILECKIIIMSW